MAELVTPPSRLDANDIGERYPVFLAGPVQGTHDWQAEHAAHLTTICDTIIPLSPRGADEVYAAPDFDTRVQIRWEQRHIRIARNLGHLSVWFAPEDYAIPGRSFAQTTRFELGRFAGWRDFDKSVRLTVGVDPSYQGGSRNYIEELCAELGIACHTNPESHLAEIIAAAQRRYEV
jgi:hypothetical protein